MADKAKEPGEFLTVLQRSQADPVFFIREVLGCKPWPKQEQIARAVWANRRTVVRSCHGSGKSWLAARVALAFLYAFPNSKVITTAPTFKQVRSILWQELRVAWHASRIPLGNAPKTTELSVDDGWFAIGVSSRDGDAAQGHHAEHVLIIVDEACGMSPEIMTAIEGNLTAAHNHIFMIGNPTDIATPFGDEFKAPGTCKMRISAFDVIEGTKGQKIPGLVTPEWIEEKRSKWGEDSPMWISRVLGDFPPQEKDRLFSLAWVERAQTADIEATDTDEKLLAVDVGRFGDDPTVMYLRHGDTVRRVYSEHKRNTMETVGNVIRVMREHGATHARIDVVGIGAGVYDRLVELGVSVDDYNGGSSPADGDRFINRRAENHWQLRERYEAGKIKTEADDLLAEELTAIKYKTDSRGRVVVEPKEDLKKRLGRSPDNADAVVMAFAGPGKVEAKVVPFAFA